MVKKNKLRYKNFNVCQLIDKGKMKLQYSDNYKEHKKTYHKIEDKKDKCSVKNINKKLLSGALILTMASTFVGCSSDTDFKYDKQKINGREIVSVEGTMARSIANDLKVIELKVYDENYLFLARRNDIKTNSKDKTMLTYEYWDVFEDYKIIELTDFVNINPIDVKFPVEHVDLVNEIDLSNYLIYYGVKKSTFTPKELKDVFTKIKDNYVFEDEKKLVKEK